LVIQSLANSADKGVIEKRREKEEGRKKKKEK
jgi:hypothetical protein